MGNCAAQKQHVGLPHKPVNQEQTSHVAQKSYVKPQQFILQIPIKQPIPQKSEGEGLMSRVMVDIKNQHEYQEYLKACEKPQAFIDQHFKHDKKSVFHEGEKPINFQWKRPLQFIKQDPVLCSYTEEIETADFKSGKMENLYLISTFASLAQVPDLFWSIIEQVFGQNLQISTKGIYVLWLFIDGKWQCIKVDDYFPVAFNQYLFSKYQHQLWILLIEKAYAKFFKSYHSIEKNILGHFFTAVTGAPTLYLCNDLKKPMPADRAWFLIRQAQKNGEFICATSQQRDQTDNNSVYSYPVMQTQEIYVLTQTDKKLERILKLDNPWGRYQWKGRWSQYSDVWSEELRSQLGYEKADETIIWISIEDLLRNFGQICINKYNPQFVNTWKQVTLKHNEIKGLFLNVESQMSGYLNLYQKDHHHFPKNYKYSMTRLILLQVNPQTHKFEKIIKQTVQSTYCSSTLLNLQAGLYYIIFQVDWASHHSKEVTINIYSDQPVGLTIDPKQINNEAIFNELIKLYEKQHFAEMETISYERDPDITRTCGQFGGYVFYHYKNNSNKNTTLTEHLDLGDSKNLQLCDTHGKQINLKVKPGEQMIVKMKVSKDSKGQFELKPKIQSKFVENYSPEDLQEMLKKKPTKVRRRQIDGEPIDVYIRTFEYSGGIALLYQNKIDKFSFIEEITLQINNLRITRGKIEDENKINLEMGPNSQEIISFVVIDQNKPFSFKTKVSYYLTEPEFNF